MSASSAGHSKITPCRASDRAYSSWAHEKGVPAKVVAMLMGHAKGRYGVERLTHVLDDSARGEAEKVGSELITIDHKSGATSGLKQPEA
jgi:hypothetical protein